MSLFSDLTDLASKGVDAAKNFRQPTALDLLKAQNKQAPKAESQPNSLGWIVGGAIAFVLFLGVIVIGFRAK